MSARQTHVCPYCDRKMEEGFVIDRQHYGAPGEQSWAEGTPVKSRWSGLKLKGKKVLTVRSWRCPDCGFLASFAQ